MKKIYDISKECSSDNVIVLRGNHEEWFLEFLEKKNKNWLAEDKKLNTSRTFLTQEQMMEVKALVIKEGTKNAYQFVRQCIRENHKELLKWMTKLPYYYTTDTQIFVHAGVDEEAGDWWDVGTPDYFVDGGVEHSGNIPVLVYDEENKKYYSLEGSLKEGRLKNVKNTF